MAQHVRARTASAEDLSLVLSHSQLPPKSRSRSGALFWTPLAPALLCTYTLIPVLPGCGPECDFCALVWISLFVNA